MTPAALDYVTHTNYKGNQDSGFWKPPLPFCICVTSPQLFWWLLRSPYLSQQCVCFALNDTQQKGLQLCFTPQKGLQLCFNPGYTHLALVAIAFYFTTLDFILRGGNKQLGETLFPLKRRSLKTLLPERMSDTRVSLHN